MFAREAAEPRGTVSQVTRGCRIVETLQIVWRTEHRGHTATTIGTVTGCIVPVPVVREAVVRVGGVASYHVVNSISLALTGLQEEGDHGEEDREEHPRSENSKMIMLIAVQ